MAEERIIKAEEPDPIRGIRLDQGDDKIFWFRDDLHNPYPITAFGMSTIQRAHMWGFATSAEEAKLPPSRGAAVKTYNGRVYLGFVPITDPEEIGRRAQQFGPFVEKSISEWDSYYGGAVKEAKDLSVPLAKKDLQGLSFGGLASHLRECQRVNLHLFYLHFMTMYVADVVYIGGEEFAGKYGVSEQDYTMMLKGFETKGLATDRGQFLLTRSALEKPEVLSLFEGDEPIEVVLEKIKETDDGQAWWGECQAYLEEFGHRSIAAILDANYPTWYQEPSIVIENIRNMIPRIKGGWDFEEERKKTIKLREEAVEKFRSMLKPEDKDAFEIGIIHWQRAHAFNEDHWFYFEQMIWSALHYTAMESGRRLTKQGILAAPEDIFHLTYDEILEAMDSCEHALDGARYSYSQLLRPLIAHRKKQFESSKKEDCPSFLGFLPDKVEDPLAIKVFGLTDFVLDKARKEMAGETVEIGNTIHGFPGAPGVVEGPARVITGHEDFPRLKMDDIVVCPYTSPAWTPIFPKIRGVVTDSGGMLTHAAITAREYGIPAVVGTWVGTSSIHEGDIIRIDGTEGVVTIVSRA